MTILQNLLLTIEGLLALGFAAGVLVGLAVARHKLGCPILVIVPAAMLAYLIRWQAEHPENLTSTSGLDFVFGPLWPSLGAVAGFYAGRWLRSASAERDDKQ